MLANWKQNFFGWNAADFGWGADRVENILWRLEHGELDGVNPKVIVLLAGTNNVVNTPAPEISRGLEKVVGVMQAKAPGATIVVTGIFPRHDNPAWMPVIEEINRNLAKLADGKRVRYLNVNDRMVDGTLDARDKLHPTLQGYQAWADGLSPIFRELLGPKGAEDHAPPPTGDPSAKR